jgi:GntR family transcriptional regulator
VTDTDAWRADLPVLRPTSRVELWVQLRDQLAERILDGRIPPDHKLWSQTDLAEALHVSRGTTIRAYEGLQEEGLVIFVAGRGLFSPMPEEIEAVKTKRSATRPK